MKGSDVQYVHVWTFGFPCQDISVAGKQAGMIEGVTRSGAFYEIIRLLREIEEVDIARLPSILLAENVKAVEEYIPEIEKQFNKRGYKCYYQLYNSKFWGVPQNRERYFIVGIHESLHAEYNFPIEVQGEVPVFSSILESNVDEHYYLKDEKQKAIIKTASPKLEYQLPPKVRRVKTSSIRKLTNCNPSGRGMGAWVFSSDGISPTLTAAAEGIKVIVKEAGRFVVRRLTPREHFRLQGILDTKKMKTCGQSGC